MARQANAAPARERRRILSRAIRSSGERCTAPLSGSLYVTFPVAVNEHGDLHQMAGIKAGHAVDNVAHRFWPLRVEKVRGRCIGMQQPRPAQVRQHGTCHCWRNVQSPGDIPRRPCCRRCRPRQHQRFNMWHRRHARENETAHIGWNFAFRHAAVRVGKCADCISLKLSDQPKFPKFIQNANSVAPI